jgi:F-type H+-transporting ATPase subunit b
MAHAPNATALDPHAAEPAAAQGGEHAAAFPPFDPTLFPSQLAWFLLTFGALYLVVSRFILPRVGSVLAARAGTISADLDQAAQKSAAADEARTAMERAVAKARADGRAMIEAARADMQAKLNAEQEAAEKRLAERITTAEARVDAARQKALAEVPGIAQALAREIADKIAPVAQPAPRQRVAGEA